VQYPALLVQAGCFVIDIRLSLYSENVSGAGNQQERLWIEAIPANVGFLLSGFALGEGSFMVVARRRSDYTVKWKLSAAFNVSQKDRVPLDLFRETLGCGTIRKAGNDGWYWEVNRLSDIQARVVPFFERFPLLGKKAEDFERFRVAARILSRKNLSHQDYAEVLALREGMNGGGKRRYTMQRILRDYTPSPRAGERLG
jgi:LAGLIDADG DNA endonuclease family protein